MYSSDAGRVCPRCGHAVDRCRCSKEAAARPAGNVVVRISRETSGRRGKTVTVVRGLPLDDDDARALAGELKRRCGSGGAVKDGAIEIQGDHRDTVEAELARRGYRVKRTGG